jgi:hypothetical protein
MNEEEFDLLIQSRPFGMEDAMRADAALRRRSTLGLALWAGLPPTCSVNCWRYILKFPPALIWTISGTWNGAST